MNFQDISDFISLVKNPKEAEALLKQIQDNRSALEQTMVKYGTVTEINALKEKTEKALNTANKKAAEIVSSAEADIAKRNEVFDSEFANLRKQQDAVNAQVQDANSKLEQAQALVASVTKREKDLAKREATLTAESSKLAALMAEYEDKVAKLRSVMV
jgi:chromosome segregation ATPase